MNRIFPDNIKTFIFENAKGKKNTELTELVNRIFGTSYTVKQIQSFKGFNKIKSGLVQKFPDVIISFIKENVKGKSTSELTVLVNQTFSTAYTEAQIKTCKTNRSLSSGLTGYFPKGHIPHNKGLKGICSPGCEKGWFKKGNTPKNHRPVGSERIDTDGYVYIKIKEPRTWVLKHVHTYEKHKGPIPQGMIVTFKDGNKQNCNIENLLLMSRSESMIMTSFRLRSKNPELMGTGLLISKIILQKNKLKRNLGGKK
ncbi:HNH endonuclease [Treponema sp. OMZ 787]|uniref:HNH endonuclease signature motif containing protein n=1 Tax=Treponema sp. OMZ 787 TaxID=2563669 RepID=UPI0020A3354B|nr:HNH endonuclease signature motif containing protein [Treponema sp. OMZ 787]UTC62567.1 HNH endonuclease [Treponema sp. OMZ 787]